MTETRKFSVHPAIIYNLIVAQAGTLGKSVIECAMNSIDAQATKLDIQADRKGLRIQDDGQGFRSRKEIEDWFEVFGFPHDDESDHRVYGKFGIGRGQLWSFCSTVWRTGTFKMDVDIKARGLDYQLIENLDPIKGVLIEGKFYTPLTTLELSNFEKEVAELARYAQIPISLNGKTLNKSPAKEKWDFETDDAWIKVTEGGQLAVYNLGMLVRRYSSYTFGCGGVVVTKPGVRLALNMARNDVLVAECQVWKRIRKSLQANSDTRVRTKRTRLTEAELENAAKRFLASEVHYGDIENFKIVTDIVGRGYTLRDFISGRSHYNLPITKAEQGSQLGERAHTQRMAFVLAPETLERFNAESVVAFKANLLEALQSDESENHNWLVQVLQQRKAIENLKDAVPTLREGYDVLKDSDLKKEERAGLRALEDMSQRISWALRQQGLLSEGTSTRSIRIGVSDVAEAWTDGKTKIVLEQRMLKLMRQGVGGFAGLANLLVHEYLHDAEDMGSHTHDQEFYHRYHEATCATAGVLNHAAMKGLRKWVYCLRAAGVKVPSLTLTDLSEVESAETASEKSSDVPTEA